MRINVTCPVGEEHESTQNSQHTNCYTKKEQVQSDFMKPQLNNVQSLKLKVIQVFPSDEFIF